MMKVLPVPGGPWHSTPRKPCNQHGAGLHARLSAHLTAIVSASKLPNLDDTMAACEACNRCSSRKSCLSPQGCKEARVAQRQHHGVAQRSLLLPQATDGRKACCGLGLRRSVSFALGVSCRQLRCAVAGAFYCVLLRLPHRRRQLVPSIAPPVQAGVKAFQMRNIGPWLHHSVGESTPQHHTPNTTHEHISPKHHAKQANSCLRAANWCLAVWMPGDAPPSRGTHTQRCMSKRQADMRPPPPLTWLGGTAAFEPSHVTPRGGAATDIGTGEPSTGAIVAIGTAHLPEKRHCDAAPPTLLACNMFTSPCWDPCHAHNETGTRTVAAGATCRRSLTCEVFLWGAGAGSSCRGRSFGHGAGGEVNQELLVHSDPACGAVLAPVLWTRRPSTGAGSTSAMAEEQGWSGNRLAASPALCLLQLPILYHWHLHHTYNKGTFKLSNAETIADCGKEFAGNEEHAAAHVSPLYGQLTSVLGVHSC
jgi:hypothetical protein